MRPYNDEFNPPTEEELRRQEEDDEFRRRVRDEVWRMQSGEADEDMERDREQREQEREEREANAEREKRRSSTLGWQFFSGAILTNRHIADSYRYLIVIAVMCLISIAVMFWSLHIDSRYSLMERDVQLLRERSIRLQERLYEKTTHQAIREELARRGMTLQDPSTTKAVVED